MKKETKRYIAELVLGFLVAAAVTAMLLFWQYETYQENLAVKARLILAENPEEEVFQILKENGDMTAEEVQDVLGDYGYEYARDSREGKRFLRNCGWTVGGVVALYLGYAAVVFYEKRRHKKEIEEQSKKTADGIARIREGDYRQDIMDWYEEEESENRILDELDSLGSYVEMMEAQARQEKQEMKTLVTDISHQLKTPVAAFRSCFEVLKNEDLTKEERQEFESRLEEQLKSLGQLVEALVNISRMETGMIELKLAKGRIFDVILEAVNRVWVKAQEKEIEIEMEAEESLEDLVLPLDSKWLCEALINLLDNAVKYSPSGTNVTIRAIKMASFLRIEIQDQGIGIARENYHKVFQRFYRGEEKEVKKEEGSGVGLYLARKIIEGHHGTISLDARKMKKEKGSVFVVQIPYQ
nr:HAMP domain-containing sensor histidine kinase [uncultured Sellimonas sp.]